MIIQRQERQGMRNVLVRLGLKENHLIQDLNNLGYAGSMDSFMSALLDDEDEVLYHKTGTFAHILDPKPEDLGAAGGYAYNANFYPLDVKLTAEELTKDEALEQLIDEVMDKHLDQFDQDLQEVRKLHPGSKLVVNICPSDSILYENTMALPFYAFVVARHDGFWLETESSYLIVPADVLSEAYR